LSQLRIIDFSRILAGPYATMLLADFGAEVIKIESPTGDDTRRWGPPFAPDGQSTYFHAVNRNKSSIVADFTVAADRQRLVDLISTADVVVENFTPGVMAKFGLDFESMAVINPKLVYCSITGFGSDHPELPGYDLMVQAVGGLMSITGPALQPSKVGVAVVDIITGLHAVAGIQAALLQRTTSGVGQLVQVNLLSSLLSALANQASAWLISGETPSPLHNRHPSIAPYQSFEAQDQSFVVACGSDGQFHKLTSCLGLDGIASDPRFITNELRVAHIDELDGILSREFALESADHWVNALTKVGVPAGRINTIDQAFAFAERLGLQPFVEIEGIPYVSTPVKFSEAVEFEQSKAPQLGGTNS
jgi:crotonobetainyl-CoA:carnitine CoA-transferase CaiB-like acyl-CoA transferase